jgi:myo-inositol-1(or 4)-monophosphatase
MMADSWLPLLKEIAREVRKEALPFFGRSEIVGRGASGDVTEKIDAVAEGVIIRILEERKVSCILVSEEIGIKRFGKHPNVYLVADPVDGTANAVNGLPFFATSLAISTTPNIGGIVAGVVMSLYDGTLFSAEKGLGAKQDGREIKSSRNQDLEEAIIGVEFNRVDAKQLLRLAPLLKIVRHWRHLGADALELCYVANSLEGAFIDVRKVLRVTDVAAAYLILK